MEATLVVFPWSRIAQCQAGGSGTQAGKDREQILLGNLYFSSQPPPSFHLLTPFSFLSFGMVHSATNTKNKLTVSGSV